MSRNFDEDDEDQAVPAPPPRPLRHSSFAQSFFQAGAHHEALQWAGDDEDNGSLNGQKEAGSSTNDHVATRVPPPSGSPDSSGAFPLPRARPPNLQRRVSSNVVPTRQSLLYLQNRHTSGGSRVSGSSVAEAAPADDASSMQNVMPKEEVHKPSLERQPSWLRDALEQGQGMSEENLQAILGVAPSSFVDNRGSTTVGAMSFRSDGQDLVAEQFDDDEVIEQYRIMAHHEARQLFKQKVGCDVEEYIQQRRAGRKVPAQQPSELETEKLTISSPPLHVPKHPWNDKIFRERLLPSMKAANIPMPALPPLSDLKIALDDQQGRPAELQMGTIISRGSSTVDALRRSSNTVRCLGCRSQLQVDSNATLVACPSCSTVSPNSSTAWR